ncbi:MAG: hypothetical protein IKV45_04825 [Firmicutes bacterium]|nr:hypothetical protein [Bacillota bacterium]
MKKTKIAVALLAVMCIFAFSACGASFDPVAFVQGSFDATFHGDITDEFVDTLVDVDSVEDYQEQYNEMLDSAVDNTLISMGIYDPSEMLKADTRDMFAMLMDAAKYEVNSEYVENEDGSFIVEVTVYPLLTYMDVCMDEDGSITAAVEAKVTGDMSYDQIMELYMEELIAAFKTAMENPTYDEGQVYEIEVFLDDDDCYTVDEYVIAEISAVLMGAV